MAFGKGLFNDAQKRIVVAVSIVLMSLSFIPLIPQVVSDLLNWEIGTTGFTVGAVLGLIGLFAAWQLYTRKL